MNENSPIYDELENPDPNAGMNEPDIPENFTTFEDVELPDNVEAIPPGTPTQVAHSGRAAVRSAFQSILPILIAVWGIILLLPEIAEIVGSVDGVPAWLIGVLNAVAAVAAILIALVAKFMSSQGINAWIEKNLKFLRTGVSDEIQVPAVTAKVGDPSSGVAAIVKDGDR